MNGKVSKKIRKEVNKQAFDQLEFVFGMLNSMKLRTRIAYAWRLIFGEIKLLGAAYNELWVTNSWQHF